jgi:FAD:protein FMN transferase
MLSLRQRSVAEVVEGVLGTQLRVHIDCRTRRTQSWLRTVAVETVLRRCEAVSKACSVFDPASEVRQLWLTGTVGSEIHVSADLAAVMQLSLTLERATRGAYHPMVGRAVRRWRMDTIPSIAETEELAELCRRSAYDITEGIVVPKVDLDGISFNSLAKGFAADQALHAVVEALSGDVTDLCAHITIGGDVAIYGGPIRVAVEHPTRAYDNEPPVRVIQVANAGVATSGATRKPMLTGGERYHHVLDPQTCRPVPNTDVAVTVVAPSAAEADAWSTALTVTGDLETALDVAALVVGANGGQQATPRFVDRFGC